jgi:hypothetical protein
VGSSRGGNSCPRAEDRRGRRRLPCASAERGTMAGASGPAAKRDGRGGSGGVARRVELRRKGVHAASRGVPTAEVGSSQDRGGGEHGGD